MQSVAQTALAEEWVRHHDISKSTWRTITLYTVVKETVKDFGFGQRGSSVAMRNLFYCMCMCECTAALCRSHFENSSVHSNIETGVHCVPNLHRGCVAKRQSTKWLCAIIGRQLMFVMCGSLRCMISRTLLWRFCPKGGKTPVSSLVLTALFCHYKHMQFVMRVFLETHGITPAKTCKVEEERKEGNGTA